MGNTLAHTRMKNDDTESLPIKALVDELQDLRSEVRQAVESYATRLDSEIARVQSTVESGSEAKSLSSAKAKDLRDMLTLLRQRQIRADKGRRKDLKKLETVISDLGMLIENW
jgi:uncharacterized coiled-coil DUF342 family protein